MSKKSNRKRNTILFFASALAWLVFDQLTKALADGVEPGQVLWSGVTGVFDFQLVHNTGAAWGLFAGNPAALGVFALLVCACLLVIAHIRRDRASALEMLSFALIFAGGLGNAIDRFAHGYVIDFIDFYCIDYPVFNVADIGVVCGFILLLIVLLFFFRTPGDADEA
ncbi:MAG: signal peptidase II [Eggerthellaceae bacterium]|jgi:signal peptidase II